MVLLFQMIKIKIYWIKKLLNQIDYQMLKKHQDYQILKKHLV